MKNLKPPSPFFFVLSLCPHPIPKRMCVCAGELVRSFVCHAVVVENCCQCGVSTNQVDPTRVHDSSTMSSECKQAGTCITRVRAGLCEVCAVSAHEAAPSLSLHEASKPLMRVTLSVSLLPLSPPMMMISQWTACPCPFFASSSTATAARPHSRA